MTEEIIIDVTKCDFNTFDGGGSQRTICTLDNCYCDGIRVKDCYYKQLKRLEQENKELKEKKEQLKKWNDENLKRQDDMQLWIDLAEEQRKKYRSALEEINRTLLGVRGLSIHCDKQIIKVKYIINEVLE